MLIAARNSPLCRGASWLSVTPELELETYQLPVISAKMYYIEPKPVEAILGFGGTEAAIYVSGVMHREQIMNPVQHNVNGVITVKTCAALPANPEYTIFVPITYLFMDGRVLVAYEVEEVNGYYRVVPLALFIPL